MGRRAGRTTPAQSTPRAVTLWAARPRGPVSDKTGPVRDGWEDGQEAANSSRPLVP